MKPISKHLKQALRLFLVLSVLCLSGTAFAINANSGILVSNDSSQAIDSLGLNLRDRNKPSFKSAIQPLRQAQSQSNRTNTALRSKSEVMQEVKSRYNGQVVKISLNERTAMYSVRVLLPSGKVKNLSVSARK